LENVLRFGLEARSKAKTVSAYAARGRARGVAPRAVPVTLPASATSTHSSNGDEHIRVAGGGDAASLVSFALQKETLAAMAHELLSHPQGVGAPHRGLVAKAVMILHQRIDDKDWVRYDTASTGTNEADGTGAAASLLMNLLKPTDDGEASNTMVSLLTNLLKPTDGQASNTTMMVLLIIVSYLLIKGVDALDALMDKPKRKSYRTLFDHSDGGAFDL
jgi:hypothetical protein